MCCPWDSPAPSGSVPASAMSALLIVRVYKTVLTPILKHFQLLALMSMDGTFCRIIITLRKQSRGSHRCVNQKEPVFSRYSLLRISVKSGVFVSDGAYFAADVV